MTKYVINPVTNEKESLQVYCNRLSKRNISVLYHLEMYLKTTLLSDTELKEIRRLILSVSGELDRLPVNLVGDVDETK